ncbi:hypothetical protein HJC23_007125, partial [Cyclotella cryptica]
QTSTTWPHYLLLEITFDSNPSQTSWKFSNARSTTVLDYTSFGDYAGYEEGQTAKERINILTEEDLDGDPLVEGTVREYMFVIYDEGGDGLCCTAGQGKYSLYSRGKLLFVGNAFGTMEDHSVSIDPADFLESDVNSSASGSGGGSSSSSASTGSSSNSTSGGGTSTTTTTGSNTTVAQWNTTITPSPTIKNTSPTIAPAPTAKPITPSAQFSVDQDRWYCGSSWDWVINNCEEAVPCPGGDFSVCPENFACFASTPCTPEPTDSPSDAPSMMPSYAPTASPTKSPWSETAFLAFLYGESNNPDGETSGNEQSSGSSNNSDMLASQVNDALQNFNELQYHFYCGYSWDHADETCNKFCPTGDRSECPDGMECYSNTRCDGRDTPPPTISPAPTISSAPVDSFMVNIGGSSGGGTSAGGGTGSSSSGEGGNGDTTNNNDNGSTNLKYETCTLCPENELNDSQSININGKTVTCRDVENMFHYENVLLGSSTCSGVQKMYQDMCCYDKCSLCETSDGDFLDLQDALIKQGGYSATCQEVNDILSATPKEDKLCYDAKKQLAGDCCYDQCTLCNADAGETTSWYATVSFQGIQSTCLGLDFMLRTEQVGSSTYRCDSIRSSYSSACCYTAPADPCQLCEADGTVYEVNAAKSVSVTERASTTSCAWINDNLAKVANDDQQCKEGKGAYFGQCCELSNIITVPNKEGDGSDVDTGSTGNSGGDVHNGGAVAGSRPNGEPGAPSATPPSSPTIGENNVSSVENVSSFPSSGEANSSSTENNYWGSSGGMWNVSEWNPPSGSYPFRASTCMVVNICFL